ncbi:pyridoxamine 5'-phosphate oxidase family protein [Acidimicrobiia bacterium EGI L10123]|uniref:pyridoxamine 5'-phosphate oxidase family protein n=1 Tax=Salinilacustrithrix flava TaxID=2957203 RepID=UPI003D7C24E0|nr:pyridoxamine 5'-phosphate oxidase family protein [Acidimicrobiia bacterium EGI L10123]
MTEVWTGFQTMTADECRRLLTAADIGRVAISAGALPYVLPVQYTLQDDHLLLRTPGHHEVGDGIDGQVVGFEADTIDLDHGVGWCVSVTGTVRVVADAVAVEPVHRWFSDGVLLALSTDVIVGHRVAV